ncbi:GNAT family N-acetyltransferase [Paenibacillus sp. 481]|uniref:GNAT family N-acetyltransferase n=1 Tax=Paenibacillus sp. 481 TaxID=2835869 RepID=UPI001E2BA889|nr:GNAT family protein [Paenibacillus sp. 481]UHA72196.1 GNAT family N-acetyltransferase [Paenibacillus sp. 481]
MNPISNPTTTNSTSDTTQFSNPLHLFREVPTLHTDRFVLRQVTTADADDVWAIFSHEEVCSYIPLSPFGSHEDALKEIEWYASILHNQTGIRWGIEDRTSGRMIGTCGFFYIAAEHKRAEIGYDLAFSHWGQGVMTEVGRKVVAFGFQELQFNRIEAKIIPENVGSEKLLTKLGFQYEGTMRQSEFEKGGYVDIAMYALLRADFTARLASASAVAVATSSTNSTAAEPACDDIQGSAEFIKSNARSPFDQETAK